MKRIARYLLLLVFATAIIIACKTPKKTTAQTPTPPIAPIVEKVVEAPKDVPKVYTYESFANDPLNARIYTLANGLKVYMTVYKDAPRIQTYIATKAGSKNDPADATGLAHYLEHMLFKGTDKYGTLDWAKEKPELDKIEVMYELYRNTKDATQRKAIYHQIDSISGVAAKYAIANEYDKMISAMGAKGNNAYTSFEQTVYVNDIPSNQLNNWLTLESERFRHPVLRIFHTELEAVYEEKNIGLDNDGSKSFEIMFANLFKKHTYGTQTTIGTIEHLKNPSLVKIKNYYDTYYVPNNMAIVMSGDFNPDDAIKMIDAKFGSLPSKPVPVYTPAIEDPITEPRIANVYGPDAEDVSIAYRLGGMKTADADMVSFLNKILYNGTAGLLDLNLNQDQKVLEAYSFAYVLKDYSTLILGASPKEGQTLEQAKDLLLAQVEVLKKGNFPDWILPAITTDIKLQQTKNFESNRGRADMLLDAFTGDQDYQGRINLMERYSKITKQQIVDFANKNFGNNYVVVYKRTGEDKGVQKVEKPAITPVEVNRDAQSPFLKNIMDAKPAEIEPVFLDYAKDIQQFTIKNNIPVYSKKNEINSTFSMHYVYGMGSNNNKKLAVAIDYLQYLGTSKLSPAQVKQEFYKLGCSMEAYNTDDELHIVLSGLGENFAQALDLMEQVLSDAKPDKQALNDLVGNILKKRSDSKLDKNTILQGGMNSYAMYGAKSPFTNILSEKELKALNPKDLVDITKSLNGYEHHILDRKSVV